MALPDVYQKLDRYESHFSSCKLAHLEWIQRLKQLEYIRQNEMCVCLCVSVCVCAYEGIAWLRTIEISLSSQHKSFSHKSIRP